jgi:hypothetical protein
MTNHEPNTSVKLDTNALTGEAPQHHFADDDRVERSSEVGEEDWPTQSVKRHVRLRIPTFIFCALLLVAVGLWSGASLQKAHTVSSSTSGIGAGRAAFGRTGGAGSPFGSISNATTGTVTDIIGNTLYVTDVSGNLVKVNLSSSATVTRNATATLGGLKPGDTVTVQGSKVTNGSMVASSVASTAKGVSTTGGFGGAGGAAKSS